MSNENETLKSLMAPCRFCGSTSVSIYASSLPDGGGDIGWSGKCMTCHARGPIKKDYADAGVAWGKTVVDPVMHILKGRLALCGFSPYLPCDWPAGHAWIDVDNSIIPLIPDNNEVGLCRGCVTEHLARRDYRGS